MINILKLIDVSIDIHMYETIKKHKEKVGKTKTKVTNHNCILQQEKKSQTSSGFL